MTTTTAAPTTTSKTTTSTTSSTIRSTAATSTSTSTRSTTTTPGTTTTTKAPTGTASGTVSYSGNPFSGVQLWANAYYASEVSSLAIPSLTGAMATKAAAAAKVPSFQWL